MHLNGVAARLECIVLPAGEMAAFGHAKAACARWGAIAPPWAVRPTSRPEESYAGNVAYETGSTTLRIASRDAILSVARLVLPNRIVAGMDPRVDPRLSVTKAKLRPPEGDTMPVSLSAVQSCRGAGTE